MTGNTDHQSHHAPATSRQLFATAYDATSQSERSINTNTTSTEHGEPVHGE